MLPLEEVIFRARALAQSHPFTPRVHEYLQGMIGRERTMQPVPELGTWAGYAFTNGYCLRRVEEEDVQGTSLTPDATLPDDLEEATVRIAEKIRTDGAEPFLLYPEERVVEALDTMIRGEIERRLTHWEDTIDENAWREIMEYIAWWVIKGYAARVAEQLVVA